MPPKEYRSISKEDLLCKYHSENWAGKLAQYRCDEWKCGSRKTCRKWFSPENDVMAFTLEYRNPGGTSLVVRLLRDGDVLYYID